jgi:outer membrane cobalamin receptor
MSIGPLSRVTDSVTVIDRADLDARQTETATEVLRLVPGFGVVASGGRGALTSIFPRGGESDYTLVFVDGIALNSFGGGFDAAHLSTAGIDRIEGRPRPAERRVRRRAPSAAWSTSSRARAARCASTD